MARHSNRDKILSAGLHVVRERGFIGASVRDIVEAAGVPHGSFTNHFASKEAFCLEVLDNYFEAGRGVINDTLLNEAMAPFERIASYVEANIDDVAKYGFKNGCLIGNFSIESTEHSDLIRQRLVVIYEEIQEAVTQALKAAVKTGDLSKAANPVVLAGFIVGSLQGAILRAKVDRTLLPLQQFKDVLFGTIMSPSDASHAPKSKPKDLAKGALVKKKVTVRKRTNV